MMQHWNYKLLKTIPRSIELLRKVCLSATMETANKIAVCQMTAIGDKEKNLEVVKKLVYDASKDNVKMIFFPECCDFIFERKRDMLQASESILGGFLVNEYRELAKKHNVWLSMGGLHEKDETNPDKVYNTHLIIDNKGAIVQDYRKLHLFDVEIPEKNVRLKESDFATAGSHIVTPVETPVGKIGLAICYDLRFPELSTQLAMMGADILTYPSAFTYATGQAHWEILLRARAIETQSYIVAAAQSGNHNAKRRSYGRAMVVSPWGEILADCGDESPAFRVVDVDLKAVERVRRDMPVMHHRRKNVYSLYCLSLRKDPISRESATSSDGAGTRATYDGPTNQFGHVRIPETCVFYRSPLTYAFVNLRCVIPGHVLIAPIRPAERNEDLTDEEATDFYKTVRFVQRLMENVHEARSCTVTIQDGVDAGQTVKHLHCHIMPRKKGDFIENDHIYLELAKNDQLTAGHPSKPARTLAEMEKEAAYLRQEIKKLIKS